MINTKEFEKELIELDLTKKEIAADLNITPNGLRKKVHNITELKGSEIEKLIIKMNLEKKTLRIYEIFFPSLVNYIHEKIKANYKH